jgi:LAS superfamily LD-carboxypeptidase LdcB
MKQKFQFQIGESVFFNNLPHEVLNHYYDDAQHCNAYDLACKLNGHSKEPKILIEIRESEISYKRNTPYTRKKKNVKENAPSENSYELLSKDYIDKLKFIIDFHYNKVQQQINGTTMNMESLDIERSFVSKAKKDPIKAMFQKYKRRLSEVSLYRYVTIENGLEQTKALLEMLKGVKETKSFRFDCLVVDANKTKVFRIK